MHVPIDTSTKVTIGLAILAVGGILWIVSSVTEAKTSIVNATYTITSRMDKSDFKIDELSKRMDKFEASKESWSFQDQLKWSVHLQRDNDGTAGKPLIRVPEPETNK